MNRVDISNVGSRSLRSVRFLSIQRECTRQPNDVVTIVQFLSRQRECNRQPNDVVTMVRVLSRVCLTQHSVHTLPATQLIHFRSTAFHNPAALHGADTDFSITTGLQTVHTKAFFTTKLSHGVYCTRVKVISFMPFLCRSSRNSQQHYVQVPYTEGKGKARPTTRHESPEGK